MEHVDSLIEAGNTLAFLLAARGFQMSDREQHDVIDSAIARWNRALSSGGASGMRPSSAMVESVIA